MEKEKEKTTQNRINKPYNQILKVEIQRKPQIQIKNIKYSITESLAEQLRLFEKINDISKLRPGDYLLVKCNSYVQTKIN